jgi:hypothetical protein
VETNLCCHSADSASAAEQANYFVWKFGLCSCLALAFQATDYLKKIITSSGLSLFAVSHW